MKRFTHKTWHRNGHLLSGQYVMASIHLMRETKSSVHLLTPSGLHSARVTQQDLRTGPGTWRSCGQSWAIFSSLWFRVRVCYRFSPVRLFATPWTVARQAPLSMGFSRQQYWGGLPFASPVIVQASAKKKERKKEKKRLAL